MTKGREPPQFGKYNIVCPYCKAHNQQIISGDFNDFKCPSCGREFRVFIATVRGKRGRSREGKREYIIRTITHSSGEGVLRFVDAGGSDLDLRSKDIMYVCYKIKKEGVYDDHPSIMCNVTTKNYTEIKKGCFAATVTCGYDSPEVGTLSTFRDNFLSRNNLGRQFTKIYYDVSPYLVSTVLKIGNFKTITRKFIITPLSDVISRVFKK